MLTNLINHIRFVQTIRTNKVTYYISKIPILKYLIPKDPYAPETKKIVIYIYSLISFVLGLLTANSMGFIYIGASFVLKINDYGKYLFAAWVIFSMFIFSVIKSLNQPSYVAEDPNTYRSLMYHLRVEPQDIASNIRANYFALGFLKRLYLFLIMPNIYFVLLGYVSWVTGILLGDAFHNSYYKRNNKIFLDVGNFNSVNGTIRGVIFLVFTAIVAGSIIVPTLTKVHIVINPLILGFLIFFFMLLSIYLDYKSRLNLDYKSLLRTYISGSNLILETKDMGTMVREKNTRSVTKEFDKGDVGEGFVMLNNIFFIRHNKLWRKRFIINLSVILIFTLSVIVMGILDKFYGFSFELNLTKLYGMILLGLYYLNFGESITQALFFNCDSSLLGYRMYNTSKNVLPNFIQRLQHVVRVHLPQSIILSIGVVFLTLMIEPGSSMANLVLVFVSFMSASILFCTHSLVNYYLFQPYTMNLELKGIGYNVMNIATYAVVYALSDLGLESLSMLKILIGSAIIYFPIAALLVYYLAPKRFKVKR